jgi:transposase, IS5 family
VTSVVGQTVPPCSDAVQVAALLDSPEIAQLVSELAATRWTGRPGYPIRTMVGMALTKSLYVLPTWTRTVALVNEHAALRIALGCPEPISVPSVHACYRFAAKLRAFKPLLDACLDRVTAALHEQLPDLGSTVAIDASDMPAYANGQRYLYKGGPERKTYSDPDASWGHRSAVSTRAAGSFYGYKLHQAVDADTGLPLAWRVKTAKDAESSYAVPLLDAVRERGFRAEVAVMDMGYDLGPVYEGFEARAATRSSRCARRPPSRPASTARPSASMASGPSPEPMPSGRRPSGAAPRQSAPR